jgi:hypothetical protein
MHDDHDDLAPTPPDDLAAGRIMTYGICAGLILVSILVIALYTIQNGVATLPVRLVRLLITGALVYGLLIGSQKARWITVSLSAIGGLGMVVVGMMSLAAVFDSEFQEETSAGSPVLGALFLLVAFFYIGAAILLAVPSPVSRYLKHRTALREI